MWIDAVVNGVAVTVLYLCLDLPWSSRDKQILGEEVEWDLDSKGAWLYSQTV